jgi:hypothetical protein
VLPGWLVAMLQHNTQMAAVQRMLYKFVACIQGTALRADQTDAASTYHNACRVIMVPLMEYSK